MPEFTEFEEENIILLALDSPDFFYRIAKFMKPEYFEEDAHQYIMHTYIEYYEKNDDIPNKEILKNIIFKELKGSDELVDPILEILDKEIDPRSLKYIREEIVKWARIKQMSMLYSEEIIDEVKNGNIDKINDIVDGAANISDVIINPFRFFEDIDQLFIEDERDYFTTGFTRLDQNMHEGRGPARREVLIWVAPTGVGKSILLVNTAVMNVIQGKKVLHISLENSEKVTGHRYMGAFTNIPIALRSTKEEEFKLKSRKIKASSGDGELFIIYFPTDTVSVREIELSIKELKRQHGFVPDVLIVDYLECLLSKNPYKNKDDYSRQKSVSSELRALAAVTNAFLASASQTNRGGAKSADEGHNLNLDNLAESFGKAMPTDYVISINQSQKQYGGNDNGESHIGYVRFFIAKNRNGPKLKVVNGKINYATMKAIQEDVQDN